MFINVQDGIIKEIVSAGKGYQSKCFGTIEVPESFPGIVGDPVAIFTDKWEFRKLSELVHDGLVNLNPDEKLDGETIVNKTIQEQVADGTLVLKKTEKLVDERIEEKTDIEKMIDGIMPIPEGCKIDNGEDGPELVPMSLDERVTAKSITKKKYNEIKLEIVISSRREAYQIEADPLFFGYQRGENTKKEWIEKIEEIKKRYPKPKNI